MSWIMKGMLLILMVLYIVSPIDACPGPIDDIIVLLIGIAVTKGSASGEEWEIRIEVYAMAA